MRISDWSSDVCSSDLYPDKYDLLMDIATEELSHLEIVGATITTLLDGVNGELKNAAEKSDWMTLMKGPAQKEQMIHQAMVNPQFLALTGGGPALTNCQGVPSTEEGRLGKGGGSTCRSRWS